MKKTLLILMFSLIMSSVSFAGGSIGGGVGSLTREQMLSLMNTENFSKVYVEDDAFRRAQARLSVADVEMVPLEVNGNSLQVRKLRSSIVDTDFSKEFLPASAQTPE